MRIGVLTGGGDCPGLNPAIRGVVLRAMDYGWEVIGFNEGWRGIVEGITEPLNIDKVEGLMSKGGTMLGSSRTNPYKIEGGVDRVMANIKKFNLDAVIAMGGEDTLGVANNLYNDKKVNIIGVPKTMDNDLSATDYTFGFDSSVTLAVHALEVMKDTGRSHRRIMVLEVMGRHAGWVALYTAIAGEADWVLIPEEKADIDRMCGHLKKVYDRRRTGTVVVSEGVVVPGIKAEKEQLDNFGHMILKKRAVGDSIVEIIEDRLKVEARVGVIGHMQRGGAPTIFDRMLGVRVGVKAVDLVNEKKFGQMVALSGTEVMGVSLSQAVGKLKIVTKEWSELAYTLFK